MLVGAEGSIHCSRFEHARSAPWGWVRVRRSGSGWCEASRCARSLGDWNVRCGGSLGTWTATADGHAMWRPLRIVERNAALDGPRPRGS
jgi:hypothetical protein